MNNLILHLISNRQGPFNTALFSQGPWFIPQVVSTPEQTLRSLLFLDKTNTDYYLKIYLAVLNAYPDWKRQFGDNLQESYAIEELMPKGVYMEGGELPGYSGGPGLFMDQLVHTLPVELHYRITYLGDNLCKIAGLETGVQFNATLNTTGDDPNKILRIVWPDAVPFVGPLQLKQPWLLGATVDIFVQPANFPFGTLTQNIRGNVYLQSLLTNYDISAAFNESKDPMEQTAMALTVLGLTNQTRLQDGLSALQTSILASAPGWLTNTVS